MMKFKYKETEKFIDAVTKYLKENFGEVRDSWSAMIKLLGDEHDIYLMAQENVYKEGLTVSTSRGMMAHPLVKIMQDAAIQQQKLMTALGITPSASLKLKLEVAKDKQEEEEEDYLDGLVK